MRNILRCLLIPGIAVGLLGGCSEKIEPKPATYSQILTGTEKKSWRMVSIIANDEGQSSGVIPITNIGISTCVTDDVFTFYANADHKLEITEGSTKCDPSDPDIVATDTWSLVNANATLEFYIPLFGGVYPWTIKTLTANVLTVEFYIPDIDASYRLVFNSTTK